MISVDGNIKLNRIGRHYIASIRWLFMGVLFHASGLVRSNPSVHKASGTI
jgi:hypothetical protein